MSGLRLLGKPGVALGGGAAPSTDPDAAAYIAAMTVSPSAGEQSDINAFFVGLKADGVYTQWDWLSIVTETSQGGLLNLKNPAQTATAQGSITFTTDRGWAGNGSTGYLETGIADNAAANFSRDSATIFAYVNSGSPSRSFGLSASGSTRIIPASPSASVNTGSATGALGNALGLSVGVRSDANTLKVYRGGTLVTTNAAAASAALTGSTFQALKSNTTFGLGQVGAWGFGSALSDAQVALFSARLITYLTARGAN